MDMLRLLMNPDIRDSATKMAAAFHEAGIDMSKVRVVVVRELHMHLSSSAAPLGYGAVTHDGRPQKTSRGQVAYHRDHSAHFIRFALVVCLFIVLARYHTDFYIVHSAFSEPLEVTKNRVLCRQASYLFSRTDACVAVGRDDACHLRRAAV